MQVNTYMASGAAILALAGCGPSTREMLRNSDLPARDASWSKRVVELEPDLAKGSTLTLERAVEIALKHHPEGIASRSVAEAATSRIGQALSAYLPQVNATASVTRDTSNSWVDSDAVAGRDRATSGMSSGLGQFSQGSDKSSENRRASASARQLVLDAGGTAASIRQADRGAQAATLDWQVTRQALAFGVREAYFTVLQNQALLAVAEESLANFERHLEQARRLLDVGRRTRFDVTKAEVDVSNARVERVRARNAVDLSRAQLNRALGLEEDPGYLLEREIAPRIFEVDPEEAAAQARGSRPDLKAAWERLEASEHGVRAAWSDYFPSVSLTGSYTLSGPKFPLVRNWSAGPTIDWNLFNGFQTTHAVREAQANVRKARADLATVEQRAYLEVRQAWLNLREARERLDLADQTVRHAEESRTLAEARYRAGQGTLLELTDAEVSLTRARAERIRSRTDYEIGVARLLKAMGLLDKSQGKGP